MVNYLKLMCRNMNQFYSLQRDHRFQPLIIIRDMTLAFLRIYNLTLFISQYCGSISSKS